MVQNIQLGPKSYQGQKQPQIEWNSVHKIYETILVRKYVILAVPLLSNLQGQLEG